MNLENGWLRRQRITNSVEYKLYCHNVHCDLFGRPQMRPGYYESDTGWGEADDDKCNACDEEMYYWEPEWHECMRCGVPVLDDDVDANEDYCATCLSDLTEEWKVNK